MKNLVTEGNIEKPGSKFETFDIGHNKIAQVLGDAVLIITVCGSRYDESGEYRLLIDRLRGYDGLSG